MITKPNKLVICTTEEATVPPLTALMAETGDWEVRSVVWPDAQALIEARAGAQLFVLYATSACDELLDLLAARPDRVPLIAIGTERAERAAPSVWLPELPPPALLASVVSHITANVAPAARDRAAPSWRRKSDMIIGSSKAVLGLLHTLDQLAPAQTPVIITGESGVGKELVARALHYCGPRASEPLIAINCAAIPDNLFEAELFGYQRGAFTGAVSAHAGAFEAADNGTLFLDEIGDMPLAMQVKLLRVLETSEVQRIGATEPKKVNFRLVSATNRNLEDDVAQGRFREDLYYRVQVYPLHIPPLRDRRDDIPPLATHHLSIIAAREHRAPLPLTPAALEKLVGYAWPGNVRELVNLLERAALLAGGGPIDAKHLTLPRSAAGSSLMPTMALAPYRDAKASFDHAYYTQLLASAGGNISLAAKLAQKTRKEIYDALRRLGLDQTRHRPA
jgi:transcriptional regulator with GAF, ATPase, and Fis domain